VLFLNKVRKYFFRKNKLFLIFIIYIVSRFFFLAKYPFFYDSPEYLRESFSSNFFSSLQRSHESIHPVYLFLIQLFQRIIPGENAWNLSLISGLFGLGSFILFFLLVRKLFNEKTALYSLIPLIFFKHIWLIETNILYESINNFFLIAGILSFIYFLSNKKIYLFILSLIFLSLGILNFTGLIIWFISILSFVLLKKRFDKKDYFYLIIGVLICLIIVNKIIFEISGISVVLRLTTLYKSYGTNILLKDYSFLDILRMFRNAFLILLNGYSVASLFSIIIFIFLILKEKNKKMMLFSFFFLIPFLLSSKFWYGGLYGRYSSFIAYFLALTFSFVYLKFKRIYFVLLFILIVSFIPTFIRYQQTPVFLIQDNLIKKIDIKNSDIIILSDYQRPQLDFLNSYFLLPDQNRNKEIENLITSKLSAKSRVFITKQAINYPYWQYDGQEIHIISKGNINKASLNNYLSNKELKLVSFNKEYPYLDVYEIKSK